jgi:hypothetical protein
MTEMDYIMSVVLKEELTLATSSELLEAIHKTDLFLTPIQKEIIFHYLPNAERNEGTKINSYLRKLSKKFDITSEEAGMSFHSAIRNYRTILRRQLRRAVINRMVTQGSKVWSTVQKLVEA